ncbi:hypothetical protein COBT_003621, partial [Conglomerata obtusa]
MIFAILRFCVHTSKYDTDIDITWNSRVVNGIYIKEYIINRIENDTNLFRGKEKQNYFRNISYENKIAIDIAPIHPKICQKLFLWVFCLKNYIENNENELPIYPVNKCCKERFLTNKCASHDAVKFRELYNVLKVDLNKIMWWHSNKLR